MYIQLIYVVVQQKLTQYGKAVIKKFFFSNFHICSRAWRESKNKIQEVCVLWMKTCDEDDEDNEDDNDNTKNNDVP